MSEFGRKVVFRLYTRYLRPDKSSSLSRGECVHMQKATEKLGRGAVPVRLAIGHDMNISLEDGARFSSSSGQYINSDSTIFSELEFQDDPVLSDCCGTSKHLRLIRKFQNGRNPCNSRQRLLRLCRLETASLFRNRPNSRDAIHCRPSIKAWPHSPHKAYASIVMHLLHKIHLHPPPCFCIWTHLANLLQHPVILPPGANKLSSLMSSHLTLSPTPKT